MNCFHIHSINITCLWVVLISNENIGRRVSTPLQCIQMLVYATYLLSPWPPQYLAKLDGAGGVKFVEADNCFEIFSRNLQSNLSFKTILAAGPLSLKQAKSFARSGHILSRFILIILYFLSLFSQ